MRLANIFDNPKLYQSFQNGVVKSGTLELIRDQVLKPNGVKNVLDFGCGNGYHSTYFPQAQYLGIEPLEECVRQARKMFNALNVKFLVGNQLTLKSIPDSSFEQIIAIGVIHHIDNEIFADFLKEAHRILKPGGRLATFDPVLHDKQSFLSKWVVSKDRGTWVRSTENYLAPFKKVFSNNLNHRIYTGLLRIPYDHIFIEVVK